jgi:hypothetical protein
MAAKGIMIPGTRHLIGDGEWWWWLSEKTFEFLQSPRIGSSFIAVMNDEAKTPVSHPHDPLHGITLETILKGMAGVKWSGEFQSAVFNSILR